jgi:hypothetical protein
MQKLQQECTDKGVVWLTINSSAPGTWGNLSPEQAAQKMTEWKTHQTALLLDSEGKAGRAYGAKNWHDEYGDAQPSQEWSAQVERGIRAGQGRRRP